MPGITFEIYKDGELFDTLETDGYGEIVLFNLEPGTYLVQEVHTDDDHVINSTPQQIELKAGEQRTQTLVFVNHALTQQELHYMEQAVQKIMGCLGVHECREVAFEETEQKLGIELPEEIKLLYMALCQLDSLTSGSERFLPLDELYLDEENLVFYKVKRTPVALSLSEGVLMNYHKKEWQYHSGNAGFLCYALERLTVKAITGMPVIRKGRIGGELKSTLSPKEPLQELFKEKFNVLEEYGYDGNVILFHENGALGWFRQNGFYADILLGCRDDTLMAELLLTDLPVKWE